MKKITRRSFAAIAVSALLALSLAGCASGAGSSSAAASSAAASAASASSSAAAAVVKDMNGEDVLEAGSAKNVLTVNSVATQMVLMVKRERCLFVFELRRRIFKFVELRKC